MKPKENAQEIIYAQEALLSIKRSAWALYQHELQQVNPLTHRHYTPSQALTNVLRWIAHQKKRGHMAPIELTPTQKIILRLLVAEGLTYKEIALRLGRTTNTIMSHMEHIRTRVGLSSTHQVIAVAVEYGWVGAPVLK